MKSIFLACLLSVGCLTLAAQNNPNSFHALSARVNAVDHGIPNDELDDVSVTYALELGYRRQFGKYFGLALPLKIGVIDVGELENPTIVGLELLAKLYPLGIGKVVDPYVHVGYGSVTESFEDANHQVPLGLGVNYGLGENSWLNLQGEYRLSDQDGRDNVQVGLGYIYRISSIDSDKDGIMNRDDACPTEAGPARTNGCPDSDGDDILDSEDACPTVAGLPAFNGCPDTDNDGLTDSLDQCPTFPGPAETSGCPDRDLDTVLDQDDACPDLMGSPEHNGCPDSDGDGVYDQDDDCPFEAAPTSDGCPITDRDGDGFNDIDDECPYLIGTLRGCPDTDGDGVADKDDRCLSEAGPASNEGCPEIAEEVVERLEFAAQAVEFEIGSAQLKQQSYVILSEIAGIMRQYPNYNLTISGHTDDVGSDVTNLQLSERRALSCLDFLAATGISRNRMASAGFGESRPKADNTTPTGRSLNRRVEFELVLQ